MKHYKIISYSDVITNSSSEVFVVHAKPEFQEEINKEIPEFLQQICDFSGSDINEMMDFNVSDNSHINEDWYYYVNKGDLIITSVDDNTIPSWMIDLIDSINFLPKFKDKFGGYYSNDLGEIDMPYYDWSKDKESHKLQKIPSIQRRHLG